MGLKDLPVRLTPITDNAQEAYVVELREVKTPKELLAFTKKWNPLYTLKISPVEGNDPESTKKTRESEEMIIAGTYDAEKALECIQKNRKDICEHATSFSCPGMCILMPGILLQSSLISRKFGVSTDLALMQMTEGYGEYMESLRGDHGP